MTTGISALQARIASIQARFPQPGGFASSLHAALPVGTAAQRVLEAQGVAGPGGASRTRSFASTHDIGSLHASRGLAAPPVQDHWADELPEQARPFLGHIRDAAEQAGVDPRMLAALVWTESGFTPDALSHAGAIGLAQLMPGTAQGLGVNPHDPVQNLAGGARYLRAQLDRFGSPALALAAYNAGPGRVEDAGGIPTIPETQAYVARVLDRFDRLVDAS